MAARISPKRLLVEGKRDKWVVPELIEANGIYWGETSKKEIPIVDIAQFEGIEELIAPGLIETELKASGLKILGIMADADNDVESRWNQIRQRCLPTFPNIHKDLPKRGVICENENGLRIGVRLMPDNASHGMLETYLLFLAPEGEDKVFDFAREACARAGELGAPYKIVHRDKAHLHTWLAWQDEPGASLHDAVKFKILKGDSPQGKPFVEWFRELYGV